MTAQRRSENTMSVPVAVSVIGAEALKDYTAAGADTLLSLSGKVPSLYVEIDDRPHLPALLHPRSRQYRFLPRRVAAGVDHPGRCRRWSMSCSSRTRRSTSPQVEVLKGPQGSLFGRNTTAGIVKFDTAQPTATWQGQGSASYGTLQQRQRRCRRRRPADQGRHASASACRACTSTATTGSATPIPARPTTAPSPART